MVRCMHMHGIYGMQVQTCTSLGLPPRAMETAATAAAAAAAPLSTSYVEPWPLVATAASAWPSVGVGVSS